MVKTKTIFYRILSIIACILLLFPFGVACDSRSFQTSEQTTLKPSIETSQTMTLAPTPTVKEEEITIQQVYEKENLIVIPGRTNTVVLGGTVAANIDAALERVEYSDNKNTAVMLFDTYDNGKQRLVLFDGVVLKDVASDVVAFRVSGDGRVVAYLTDTNDKNELFIYHCDSGESILISESVGPLIALSPNGLAIAFTKYTDSGKGEEFELFSCVLGEKQIMLGDGMFPVALTDDGTLVYAIETDLAETQRNPVARFVVYRQEDPVELSVSLYNLNTLLYFNEDCTQVLFSDEAGISLSQYGGAAIGLESDVCLSVSNYAVKRDDSACSTTQGFEYLSFFTAYSGTELLNNLLMSISNQNSVGGYLWCVTKENLGVRLTKIRDSEYDQSGSSVLANNWINEEDALIYISDISDLLSGKSYNPDIEKHISIYSSEISLLSSSNTIYYGSGDGPEDDRSNGIRPREMSAIYVGAEATPVVISSSCVHKKAYMWTDPWIDKFSRDGKPDIIYYLEYTEPESFENENEYISWFYYDLYMIEDVQGAKPVLIAENVAEVGCGEYGVYYLALNQVSLEIVMHFRNDPNDLFFSDEDHPSEADISDRNDLYYSADGTTFTQVATIEKQYWFGG